MRRIEPFFPRSHGKPALDDRRVISGIIFVIRNGLRWRDAPLSYGPYKTLYDRFVRWSRMLSSYPAAKIFPGATCSLAGSRSNVSRMISRASGAAISAPALPCSTTTDSA